MHALARKATRRTAGTLASAALIVLAFTTLAIATSVAQDREHAIKQQSNEGSQGAQSPSTTAPPPMPIRCLGSGCPMNPLLPPAQAVQQPVNALPLQSAQLPSQLNVAPHRDAKMTAALQNGNLEPLQQITADAHGVGLRRDDTIARVGSGGTGASALHPTTTTSGSVTTAAPTTSASTSTSIASSEVGSGSGAGSDSSGGHFGFGGVGFAPALVAVVPPPTTVALTAVAPVVPAIPNPPPPPPQPLQAAPVVAVPVPVPVAVCKHGHCF